MFLFIAQNHQDFFLIFKICVHREYDNIHCIINENKNEKIDKNDFENVHYFLLNEFSHEWNVFLQKRINRLNNKNEINNENSIKNTKFNKFANVDNILTRKSIQDFDDFCRIWMSFFNVINEFDHSKFFAAKLWFFFENNAINFLMFVKTSFNHWICFII
jgi:hypothetical protein